MAFEHGPIGEAIASRKILSQQCEHLPGFFIQLHEDAIDQNDVAGGRVQTSSMMCVPLFSDEREYGILCLHHCKSEYFNTTHVHFFSLFAKFFVQILLNFRYTHDLKEQVKERTEQLEDALKVARKLQRDFRDLSLVDEQTGLPNRRFFCDQSQTALSRATRYQRAFSCCIIEIKHIGIFSEKDGLLAEDQRLQALADMLKILVREADILAHLRGDQFIVSLPESDAGAAIEFAERIKLALLEAGKNIDLFDSVQLHIGLATLDADMPNSSELALKELMTGADRAMRAAKNLGKNICHIHDLNGHDLDMSNIS
jgi:diguanylate cyclase (GGDEF)-like protein